MTSSKFNLQKIFSAEENNHIRKYSIDVENDLKEEEKESDSSKSNSMASQSRILNN